MAPCTIGRYLKLAGFNSDVKFNRSAEASQDVVASCSHGFFGFSND